MTAPKPRQTEIFRREILRLNRESVEAFNRGDIAACAGFYAKDALMLLPQRPPINGRRAIEEHLRDYATTGITLIPVEPLSILSSGDIGCCAGTFRFQIRSESGDAARESGKFVTVLQRQPDGSWKAVIDCFFADTNSDWRAPSLRGCRGARSTDMTENDDRLREEARETYQKGAWFYDWMVWLYYLFGMRIGQWRRKVIEALALRPGDTVVEIGCGTGLNFASVEQAIGEDGKIIGVDISEAMLERARARVKRAGWKNVKLVCSSAADYRFPQGLGGIFATGVLNYEPAYDEVIKRGAESLAPGRRWVVLDYKMPETWLRHLAPAFVFLGSSFGVSRDLMKHHPWESVQRHLRKTRMEEIYGGFVYIISGEAT